MRLLPTDIKRIVVKVSTQMITDGVAEIFYDRINVFVKEISELIRKGYEIIIVSSGAIGCGLAKLGLKKRPNDFKKLQALAAVGQIYLMKLYQEEFNKYDLHIGQILLSADDMKDSARRTNTRNTIEVLLNKGIIPIINENDSVAIEELSYGDNDKLSGLVSILLFVDLLIILTDVKGLCDKNPNIYPEAKIISQVDKIDQKLEELVQDFDGGITFGGMKSKIDIIKRLTNIGIPAIISSYDEVSLKNILDGKEIGTYFLPQK